MHVLVIASLVALCAPFAFAQEFQPIPVSEYAEKTGPNTVTFLCYPKYYKTSEGELTPVITDLVESKSAEWDFEVETGIWTLRVRTDGTFQAEHQGNVFTYRLSQMGVGRGEEFQAFEWGEPNWKNYQVIGDAIRWYDVFPNIDLKVRYIHDILKVDVIVKAELMRQIRTEVLDGKLNADDYLTARFDIPNVWVTGEARQVGEPCDLYAERLDVQQPVEFVKDGKVVQKLRPVETYVLDEKGEPIVSFEEDGFIRTTQTWQLKKDASGVAEMSACLGDLAKAQDGDVVIDPSSTFSPSERDTLLVEGYGPYGSDGIVNWSDDERLLFGFDINTVPSYSDVQSSSLQFKIYQNRTAYDAAFSANKVTTAWQESAADWDTPWTNDGGDYDSNVCTGNIVIDYDYEGWFTALDVTNILNSHISNETTDVRDKGFLLKRNLTYDDSSIRIYTNNATNVDNRPKLSIDYITVHRMSFYAHSWFDFNISTADSWISAGNTSIQDDSGIYDNPAEARMVRIGGLSMPGDFNDNKMTVLNNEQADQIFDLLTNYATGEHRVYIVSELIYDDESCDGLAEKPGHGIIMLNVALSKTLAHELGHNVGLSHTSDDSEYSQHIMYRFGTGWDSRCILRFVDKYMFEGKYYCEQ